MMSDTPPVDSVARIAAARDAVRSRAALRPRIALVLGSGLGGLADSLDDATALPYRDLPHWPSSTVSGHAGRLVVGRLAGVPVAVMQGRVHLYEGYPAWQVAFPVRVLAMLGSRALLVTNAAGAVNETFAPGDLMLIRDHLNLQGANPCVGTNLEGFGPRFFDMTRAYHPAYLEVARRIASRRDWTLREGVYAAMLGPSYETPAEIRMLRTLGADAVGMSTVPEVTAAVHAGLRVAGISCITNMAAGILDEPLDHDEVMATGERVRDRLAALVGDLVRGIADVEGWTDEGPSASGGGTAT